MPNQSPSLGQSPAMGTPETAPCCAEGHRLQRCSGELSAKCNSCGGEEIGSTGGVNELRQPKIVGS